MPAGRPTKCTPEVTEEIRKIVAAGNYVETACDYVGISRQSHYNWMRDGEAAWEEVGGDVEAIDDPSRRAWAIYFDTTRRAEAQAEIRNVSLIQQAAQGPVEGDTRNAMWWLEKRKQHTWGERKLKTELSGPGGGAVEVHWIEKLREACGEEDEDGEG